MQLTDFSIEYNGVQIDNILMSSWMDMPNGFAQDGCCSYSIMVKIVYVDNLGRLLCIEDFADKFRFRPKLIDITNED